MEQIVRENFSPQSRLRVEDAIRRFDEAAVFTIHGFCQRILGENAFESGVSFDAALVAQPQDFMLEIAQDFWRKEFYEADPEQIAHALKKGRTPEYYAKLLNFGLKYPGIAIIPQVDRPVFSAALAFENARSKVAQAWTKSREQVLAVFESGQLNGTQYGTPDSGKSRNFAAAMDSYVAAGEPGLPLFEAFKYFCAETVQGAVKKNCKAPDLDFFRLCQDLNNAALERDREMDQYLLHLDWSLFRFAEETAPERKRAKNIRFFDDLVLGFQKALSGPMGPALTEAVRKKYRAALIDEFQDTDAAQYEIFYKLFTGKNQALFLIGDPKQAIYGFRGADLFSYLQASRKAEQRYSLANNWRSTPELIRGVNAVFSRNPNPFVLDEIQFKPVLPKPGADAVSSPDDPQTAALEIWALPPQKNKAVGIGEVVDIAVRAVTSEVVRLLGAPGKRQYAPGDIAVLVRFNRHALAVREGLQKAGIHSVLKKTGDLFKTTEAVELRRIMAAVASNRLQSIKSALSVSYMGWTALELDRLIPGEEGVEEVLTLFSGLHEVWQKNGFMRMFTTLQKKQNLSASVLALPGGERSLTNILHLAEVLHQAERERKLGVSGLIKWLDRQMDPGTPRNEEFQLRLESDAQGRSGGDHARKQGAGIPCGFLPVFVAGVRAPKERAFGFS